MMRARTLGAALAVAFAIALGALGWTYLHGRHPQLLVQGGDGGPLPLADPRLEHLDPAALERAARDPAAADLAALIVTRHGHVVFARYGRGYSAETRIDSGPLARVLVALLAGAAVRDGALAPATVVGFQPERLAAAIERGTHQSYVQYLSHSLWSRLNAAPAWIELPAPGAAPPLQCCFRARIEDWLRVGGLLVNDGSFEDTQILARGWVVRMRQPISADGSEGFGVALPSRRPGSPRYEAADLLLVRGPGRWRLWAIPSLKLVVLFGARSRGADAAPGGAGAWDESRLPNLVIDAVTDRPAADRSGPLLQQLVPGH